MFDYARKTADLVSHGWKLVDDPLWQAPDGRRWAGVYRAWRALRKAEEEKEQVEHTMTDTEKLLMVAEALGALQNGVTRSGGN